MPNPILIGASYYLRVHVPRDVATRAKGTELAVPLGDGFQTVRVGTVVKVSLQTKDTAEAKRRFTQALAAVHQHWESLRRGPIRLNHKQCVALAGEVRQTWLRVFDDDPESPEMWRRVRAADAEAKRVLDPFAELTVEPKPKRIGVSVMEARFGGLADSVLRKRGLLVDAGSRQRLIEQISNGMADVARINLKKAEGDYSETGESTAFPAFEPANPAVTDSRQRTTSTANVTFVSVIEEEVRRRAAGKDSKPLPELTARKFKLASQKFAAHRKSTDVSTVTAREAEDWKMAMLEAGSVSNNTISQRLENVSTVIDWARKHSLGDLFPAVNPMKLVERPRAAATDSSERTLRSQEARAILLAAREASKPELRWLPWMMAYSGARVQELAQLTPPDFFQLDGEWFYRVTTKGGKSLKNAYGIRRVPVHPSLVAEGLIEFVMEQRRDSARRLFPPRSQGNLASWVRNTVGLTRKEVAPNHGWRHLFEDKALVAGMDVTARHYITGRTTGHSSEGYGKSDAMLPALAAEMKKLQPYLGV